MKGYYLEYSEGANGGKALYVQDKKLGIGARVIGPKCWGFINPVHSFALNASNIDAIVTELARVKELLAKENQ